MDPHLVGRVDQRHGMPFMPRLPPDFRPLATRWLLGSGLTPGPSDEGGLLLLWLFVPSMARNAAFSARNAAFSVRSMAFSLSTAATRAATVSTCAPSSLISATTSSPTASGPC